MARMGRQAPARAWLREELTDSHKAVQLELRHSPVHSAVHRSWGPLESRQLAEREESIGRSQSQRLVLVVEPEQGDCCTLD